MSGSHIFGWDLPPGVSMNDIENAYGYEEIQPRCDNCKGFLSWKPDRTEDWEDGLDCDGIAVPYEMDYSEGLVQILGEDFRDKTYTEYVSKCGEHTSHPAHREIFWAGVIEYRECHKCKHVNKETK